MSGKEVELHSYSPLHDDETNECKLEEHKHSEDHTPPVSISHSLRHQESLHDGDSAEIIQDDIIEEEDDNSEDLNVVSYRHKHHVKKEVTESFDFNPRESLMWRKHQFRRYYQSKGKFWTASRKKTAWQWSLIILTGLVIGLVGALVAVFTEVMTEWKFEECYKLMESKNFAGAFFAIIFFNQFYILVSGSLCYWEPDAAGSGIPEIRAFLNGINMSNILRTPVLVAKVIAMCFTCAAGLPLGKEGPMIHSGSIIGARLSQGFTLNCERFDTSWNTFQDFRNDHTKRDYVTIGSAAGVAAAFRAPIGGILFALEEGSSFWSNNVTFSAFMCASVTFLTIAIIFPAKATSSIGMFAFGQFQNFHEGRSNYFMYELPLFMAIGALGGLFGALFVTLNKNINMYRKKYINAYKWKKLVECCVITFIMAFTSYILPMCWQNCSPIPDITDNMSTQEVALIGKLVPFQCEDGFYNPLASLYFTSSDVATRQLFHFREVDGVGTHSLTSGPLILFFIPYFLIASITTGIAVPSGLFVPTFLAGGAMGRLVGHWLNIAYPGYVADSGTYALIGAAAMLGGVARMTIAGCVIVLEACGNISYLLPLMLTFATARYVGNAFTESMYEMAAHLKQTPYLEGTLHSLGMLNHHPISKVMATNVVTLNEVDKVKRVMEVLLTTQHNAFPVVSGEGRLRGLILRKTLCTLLKLKAYSTPIKTTNSSNNKRQDGGVELEKTTSVFYDTLERSYPKFPTASSLKLTEQEMSFYLDIRGHMDPAPLTIHQDASVRRSYHLFRTMGMRHIVIIDGEFKVVGIITRADMNEHRLSHFWDEEGEQMQKDMNVDNLPPAVVYDMRSYKHHGLHPLQHQGSGGGRVRSSSLQSTDTVESEVDAEILINDLMVSDSPPIMLRKQLVVSDVQVVT